MLEWPACCLTLAARDWPDPWPDPHWSHCTDRSPSSHCSRNSQGNLGSSGMTARFVYYGRLRVCWWCCGGRWRSWRPVLLFLPECAGQVTHTPDWAVWPDEWASQARPSHCFTNHAACTTLKQPCVPPPQHSATDTTQHSNTQHTHAKHSAHRAQQQTHTILHHDKFLLYVKFTGGDLLMQTWPTFQWIFKQVSLNFPVALTAKPTSTCQMGGIHSSIPEWTTAEKLIISVNSNRDN